MVELGKKSKETGFVFAPYIPLMTMRLDLKMRIDANGNIYFTKNEKDKS